MKTIGVGIIGCGAISVNHIAPVQDDSRIKLNAVCDIITERVESVAKEYNCVAYTDYIDLLSDISIQVVHILLPHYLHIPVAIKALEFGKHVVLEKPVGINVEEMELLYNKAKETGLTVGVVFQNRFNPTTIEMKKRVRSGTLGNFLGSKGIVTWHRDEAYYSESTWRGKLATEGGGVLINQAIHTLDLLQYIGGDINRIDCVCTNMYHPDIEVEDTAMLTLFYNNGGIGSFYATNNYVANSSIELEFVFEKGRLRLLDQDLYLTTENGQQILVSDCNDNGEKSYWGQGHKDCIQNIYDHIIQDEPLLVTLEEAIKGTRLVLDAYAENTK